MHIPDAMLQGSICPVTAMLSGAGIIAAAVYAVKSDKRPSAARFGAISALVFAGQMMNFPIYEGTSGHLLGGVLASALLGTPFGVLAIAAVVAIQCLVFADGGLSVLGANLLNMSVIGAGLGGMLYHSISAKFSAKYGKVLTAAGAAWISVVLASLAVSIELALGDTISFAKVASAMLLTHAVIGIGEALITGAGCILFSTSEDRASVKRSVALPLGVAAFVGLLLSSFASGSPDGLEWVAGNLQFLHEGAPEFVGVLPDYAVPALSNETLSTGVAGIIGVVATFAAVYVAGWLLAKIKPVTA